MVTHNFTYQEMSGFKFHLSIIEFHRQVIQNYVRQIATSRLGLKPNQVLKYDLNKGEAYIEDKPVDKPKKENKVDAKDK